MNPLYLLVGLFLKKKPLTPHQCFYEPIGVQPVTFTHEIAAPVQTSVLVRCQGCGTFDSNIVEGNWTLSEVRKSLDELDQEDAEFERMVR